MKTPGLSKRTEINRLARVSFLFLFSPPLVARSTVSLSVRRHSTAAALAQSATLESQENR